MSDYENMESQEALDVKYEEELIKQAKREHAKEVFFETCKFAGACAIALVKGVIAGTILGGVICWSINQTKSHKD